MDGYAAGSARAPSAKPTGAWMSTLPVAAVGWFAPVVEAGKPSWSKPDADLMCFFRAPCTPVDPVAFLR